ncbi:MAG: DUF2249 domain-containing protein [Firmicutes bacterium]|nr:DUF2249 domain-containing protein [Bacillota bacterium]
MSTHGPTQAIRDHHRQLLRELERSLAGLSSAAAQGVDGSAQAQALVQWLRGALLPHARGEERALYPAGDPLVARYGRASATMSIDHEYIERYIREIEAAARAIADASEPSRAGALRRLHQLALQLAAIFRLHLDKEERVYLALLEAHLSEAEQHRVLEAMHEPADPGSRNGPGASGSKGSADGSPVLDVRETPPPMRHPLIFETYHRLRAGEGLVLVNDHDPKPLYCQFAAELPGQFTWEYLQSGPKVWRVRIGKPVAWKRGMRARAAGPPRRSQTPRGSPTAKPGRPTCAGRWPRCCGYWPLPSRWRWSAVWPRGFCWRRAGRCGNCWIRC